MTDERRSAEEFTGALGAIFADSLASVLLYGSAARGEYRRGISDINLLVIVRELPIDLLSRVAVPTREWVAGGNPPPLLLTEGEWRASADVFPLEYSDIRDSHVLLAGRSPFDGMRIRREDLRHQLEHELRSKKIQLREGYLVGGEAPQEVGDLLIHSFPTFLALFRGALRLAGRTVPATTAELVGAAAEMIGFDSGPLATVMSARAEGHGLDAPLHAPLAAAYLAAVERAVAWLDRFEPAVDAPDEI
jgi:hypothetical protein